MGFAIKCGACGTAVRAEYEWAGELVECGRCGHQLVVPTLVDWSRPAVKPDDAAVEPAVVAASLTAAVAAPVPFDQRARKRATFGGLGEGPAWAVLFVVAVAVAGIVSPVPIWAGVAALPVYAVLYFTCKLPGAMGWRCQRPGRRPVDVTAAAAGAVLMAVGGSGGLVVWGLMVHGKQGLMMAGATPATPAAVAGGESALPPLQPVRNLILSHRPFVPGVPGSGSATRPATRPVTRPARKPASVADTPTERQMVVAAEAARRDEREELERQSGSHMRVLASAVADYADAHKRYPFTWADLPTTPAVRDALRSPFDAPDKPPAGYVLIPTGLRPSAKGGQLALIYDAAELAATGAAVGLTPAGRSVFIDADAIAEQRSAWVHR